MGEFREGDARKVENRNYLGNLNANRTLRNYKGSVGCEGKEVNNNNKMNGKVKQTFKTLQFGS